MHTRAHLGFILYSVTSSSSYMRESRLTPPPPSPYLYVIRPCYVIPASRVHVIDVVGLSYGELVMLR